MKKKVLVVYYTQTGQQKEILDNILKPLAADTDVALTFHRIQPVQDYPFPWDSHRFFDAFPESFLQIPCALHPVGRQIHEQDYDLVILGYQVWYLSPSIPFNSFLKSEEAKMLLRGRPVITVINCRNMWVMAQEKVKKALHAIGAHHVGNIVLVDRHLNHISVITIVHWMMKGKKDSYLGLFPKPGVSDQDIKASRRFGEPVLAHLKSNSYTTLQQTLVENGAVRVKPILVFTDKRANSMFAKWAKLIRSKGLPGRTARKPWLKAFNYYLIFAIWVLAPIVSLLFLILHLPFRSILKKEARYFQSVNIKEPR
ncbi:hypothetical protein SAMN05660226_02996 [Parapedobacter luteus]|uniref:Dialkylresorcinol condensing enzyme DarA n=1 Tax=Parapedobacter luteus TaxID=623280 RepID=A0A1T5DUB0_9SPHI|nr:hypothetical protein [Parapedobacter luteus]SKB75294.1 hypothetical protein SAMN05660226_02996 [Parapedobacter luteus]